MVTWHLVVGIAPMRRCRSLTGRASRGERLSGRCSMNTAIPRGWRRLSTIAVFLCAVALSAVPTVRGDDSLVEAERRTIATLIRNGDLAHAAAVCKELLTKDPTHYQDHLTLAHIDEKLGKPTESLAEYETVLDLVPEIPQDSNQRSARAEADRRVRSLDPTAEKLQVAISDFDKKLQSLERAARESSDRAGIVRIERLRNELAELSPKRRHIVVNVPADAPWFDTGFTVISGEEYAVVAVGEWATSKDADSPSDAGGRADEHYGEFPLCALLGGIVPNHAFLLGTRATFIASDTGFLKLSMNAPQDGSRKAARGSQRVYIGLVPAAEPKANAGRDSGD
jgi:hypothetical protein